MFAINGTTCAALRPAMDSANRASGKQRVEVVMDDYSMPFPSSATFLSLLSVQLRLSIASNPSHPCKVGKIFSAL